MQAHPGGVVMRLGRTTIWGGRLPWRVIRSIEHPRVPDSGRVLVGRGRWAVLIVYSNRDEAQ